MQDYTHRSKAADGFHYFETREVIIEFVFLTELV